MVYPVGVVAALCLAVGYVLQQRAAMTVPARDVLHWRLLLDLLGRRQWLAGIGFMVAGEGLAGWALGLADVSLVEPLLSTNLLFAIGYAAVLCRTRPRPPAVLGALLLSAALGGFIVAADPRTQDPLPPLTTPMIVLALGVTAAVVVGAVVMARRVPARWRAMLLSGAAGILLGLQDAATRQALLGPSWTHVFVTPWSLVVVAAAVVSLLLSQSAFRSAPLRWSLPPMVAAEPVAGIAIGIGLLGNAVDADVLSLLYEALCLLGMVAGVVLITRSPIIGALHRVTPPTGCDDVAEFADRPGAVGRPVDAPAAAGRPADARAAARRSAVRT